MGFPPGVADPKVGIPMRPGPKGDEGFVGFPVLGGELGFAGVDDLAAAGFAGFCLASRVVAAGFAAGLGGFDFAGVLGGAGLLGIDISECGSSVPVVVPL